MTEQDVIAAVDAILRDLDRKSFRGEAINWGDLRCVEARRYDGNTSSWHIAVEEADPASYSLCAEVENALYQQYGLRADVDTEW